MTLVRFLARWPRTLLTYAALLIAAVNDPRSFAVACLLGLTAGALLSEMEHPPMPSENGKKTKPAGRSYSLADYRTQARREPYVLDLDDEKSISIEQPSVDALLDLTETSNARDQLRLLCGEDRQKELLDAIGTEDAGVLNSIVTDMRGHFKLGE